jgi:hypothetical protein
MNAVAAISHFRGSVVAESLDLRLTGTLTCRTEWLWDWRWIRISLTWLSI